MTRFEEATSRVAKNKTKTVTPSEKECMVTSNTMTAEFITDAARLKELYPQWAELVMESASSDLFIMPEFFHSWWEQYSRGKSLYFCALWNADRLDALAPLYKKRKGPFRVVNFVGQPSLADRMDLIVRKGAEEECIGVWLDWLYERSDWDLLELKNMGAYTQNAQLLKKRLDARNTPGMLYEDSVCPYFKRSWHADFDAYIRALGKGTKKSYRKANKLIEETPGLEWSFTDRYDEALLDAMKVLDTQKSKRGARGECFFLHGQKVKFLKSYLKANESKGLFRIYTFKTSGKLVSHLLVFLFEKKILAYQVAYDASFSRHRLGIQNIFNAIRQSFDQPMEEFDLLKGDESYKYSFNTQVRQCWKLLAFRDSLASKGLHLYFKHIKPVLKRKSTSKLVERPER